MAYKEIVIHLDGSKGQEAFVKTVAGFARKHNARLVGVYAGTAFELPAYIEAQLPPEVLDTHLKQVEETAEDSMNAFRKMAEAEGVPFDVRRGDSQIAESICLHSRYADIAAIMQPNKEDDGAGARRDVADHVVLGAGAPVLMVPHRWTSDTIGKKIVVAWDGSMQAARAGRDAMPLLHDADEVHVLTVGPKPGARGIGDVPGADYTQYLASHNVEVELKNIKPAGQSVGDAILEYCRDIKADLLVSGGYGHARIGELILGGVTDTLIERATIPLLMSH